MRTSIATDGTGTAGLEVAGLSVAYGGNLAVSNVSFQARLGVITGLIGPNGAGKTTIFNACNGMLQTSAGAVSLFGSDVTKTSIATRARAGMGRTFQRVEMVNAMTVRANVALGLESRIIGDGVLRQFFVTRSEHAQIDAATEEALQICGIQHLADTSAATLSTGQRRLVELARVLAGGFRLLLLDEPSSGLDEKESRRFGEILIDVVAQRDIGILLVEHDMALVMDVCAYLYVLDFGHLVFEGVPGTVIASPIVRAAYLGDDVGLKVADET